MGASRIDAAAGEHLKHDGMDTADQNTNTDWALHCDAAIEEMARRGIPFQAADLIAAGLVGEPDHPNQWGPRFGYAARRGVIRQVSSDRSKRKLTRRSLLHTWVGVHTKEAA